MNREDLFQAIGQVEEERLARSEMTGPSDVTYQEETEMKKQTRRSGTRTMRNLLIAAVLVAALATTAFAYTGFVVYENPRAMLEAFFGMQPEPHGDDCGCADCTATVPTYERVPLDEDAAQQVEPYIAEIGDSLVYEPTGYKFTLDAHTYDPHTGVGLLYYTMERTEDMAEYPIEYNLEDNGEIWGVGDVLNVHHRLFLIQGESIPTRLKIAAYYIRSSEENLVFSFGDAQLYDETTGEFLGYDPEMSLTLPFQQEDGMEGMSLENGNILISPIGLVVKGELPAVEVNDCNEPRVYSVAIRYKDGTEYLVKNDSEENLTMNYGVNLMVIQDDCMVIYALNRVVDLNKVDAVIVNGIEYPIS